MLVKTILKRNDEMFESIDPTTDKQWALKSFGAGMLEGLVDTTVILGTIALIGITKGVLNNK